MNEIQLYNVCPQPLVDTASRQSGVWHRDVCFEKGKAYLIEADSGTGKSSLCNFLCGYRKDYKGQIQFDHKDISRFSIEDWCITRQRHLSYLIQDLRLFPELTVLENIEIKNSLTHHVESTRIIEWLDELELAEKQHTQTKYLSFGQQQRVAAVRALTQPFDFMILDEPISHLDNYHGHKLAQLIEREVRLRKAGIIVTSIGKRFDISYDSILHL